MIKKLLLVMILLISSASAINEDVRSFLFFNDSRTIIILGGDGTILDSVLNPNPKDWVAIYKQGDSNDWKNVVRWYWVKDKVDKHHTSANIKLDIPDGDYEIRYFLNNSYTTFASKKFKLTSDKHPFIKMLNRDEITTYFREIRFDATYKGPKTWVGLFKKEASNHWSNVISWSWVNKKDKLTHIKFPFLQEGNYELRLFYDNSYKLKAKESFIVKSANIEKKLGGLDGILVAPGFGERGIEGKIDAVEYARVNKIPFFGICLGMQMAVIEFGRNVLGYKTAHTTEIEEGTSCPVINLMDEQKNITNMGGTMRLGAWKCELVDGSIARDVYNQKIISERHRHRYEFNNDYKKEYEDAGMKASGLNPDTGLVEIVEIEDHPWFVGVQFHPEYKSTVMRPHPLFVSFVKASLEHSLK